MNYDNSTRVSLYKKAYLKRWKNKSILKRWKKSILKPLETLLTKQFKIIKKNEAYKIALLIVKLQTLNSSIQWRSAHKNSTMKVIEPGVIRPPAYFDKDAFRATAPQNRANLQQGRSDTQIGNKEAQIDFLHRCLRSLVRGSPFDAGLVGGWWWSERQLMVVGAATDGWGGSDGWWLWEKLNECLQLGYNWYIYIYKG